ncbi:MAG: transcription termination/antitermination protein NusA [Bacilli bacterium]|nr:transcription termination/antitermination protein NusA [Bacilli bacterium]
MKKIKEEVVDKAKEFLIAVENIVKEKGIDAEIVYEAMETALTTAFKKNYGKSNSKVVINRDTGEIKVYSYVTVVDDKVLVTDEEGNVTEREINPEIEIHVKDAKKINKNLKVGDTIDTEIEPKDEFSRVATSTAKQVVIQKIREAERSSILAEFDGKVGELLLGTVALEDSDNYYIDLGRSNGVLPKKEIIPGEVIEMGSSIKVYVTKIDNTGRNLLIKLSRRHFGFVRRLFELEIPEFTDGTIMMYGVAREAGIRSKVCVYSENERVDAIGACIGDKGSRIANIIKELKGEKVDLIKYDKDPKIFIENALAPAKNLTVVVTDPKEKVAIVVADKDNIALAVGKKAINAKLASRLTKYQIDIKSIEDAKKLGIKVE